MKATYSHITQQLLIDHAVRTLQDPAAHPEHVKDASYFLVNANRSDEGLDITKLAPFEIRQLRNLLAKAKRTPGSDTPEPGVAHPDPDLRENQ
jgi:hypothetical protein